MLTHSNIAIRKEHSQGAGFKTLISQCLCGVFFGGINLFHLVYEIGTIQSLRINHSPVSCTTLIVYPYSAHIYYTHILL